MPKRLPFLRHEFQQCERCGLPTHRRICIYCVRESQGLSNLIADLPERADMIALMLRRAKFLEQKKRYQHWRITTRAA